MKKIVLGMAISLFISGCASVGNQPMTANNRAAMKGKSIAYTVRENKDFVPWTLGKAMGYGFATALAGGVGGIASGSAITNAGDKIVTDNHINDPAKLIAAGLSKNLKAAHAGTLIMPPIRVETDNENQIVAAAKGAQYVVDVQTLSWGFSYFPLDFTHYDLTHYGVYYKASARVLDVQTKAVIAQGGCFHQITDNKERITYDALLGDGATRLKSELSLAATQCVEEITRQILAT